MSLNHFKLTKRQESILSAITEEHIETASPVGSKVLIEKYFKNLSSATIRNEMSVLEKNGLLEKTHISSGRIPSVNGFTYYREKLMQPCIDQSIRERLLKIMYQRNLSIDMVIDKAAKLINEITNLPTIVSSCGENETLKRIDLIKIDDHNALIIIITSLTNVIKHELVFSSDEQFDDVSVCIRVFNDRLVDTPINNLAKKIDSISFIVKQKVKQYEYVMQEFVAKIFKVSESFSTLSIHGTKSIISQPEFKDVKKLSSLLEMLEKKSIWNHIGQILAKTGKTSFISGNELSVNAKNITIASIPVSLGHNRRQLAIVGPNRMDYNSVEGILNLFKQEIEKIWKKTSFSSNNKKMSNNETNK